MSIVVEKASLPAAVFEAPSSSAASAASADSVACPASAGLSQSTQTGEKTMETISAILLYMTKDAYYIKLRDGKTLSVKGDAVKSVVWDSVPK